MQVRLDSEIDFEGFRTQARALLAQQVPPEGVHWCTPSSAEDLFGAMPLAGEDIAAWPLAHGPVGTVPAGFLPLCETVVLHRDPARFALLYRLLWRFTHEPGLRHDPLDPDILQASQMAHAVRRDSHKMHAFLRFRQVRDGDDPADPLHVAWFEPDHHIVEANAEWFRRRFTNMRWAILTPERSVAWDGRTLRLGPGARREQAPPADAGEALWLTYYRHIFNPARLKLQMMQKEMPRKYWRNLPEAVLIAPLAAGAMQRSGRMIEQPATQPARRIAARAVAAPVAPAAGSLPALHESVQRCRQCPIGSGATQAVNGEGPMQPALMFVGEQPGDQEDLRGQPFVGPAGRLLAHAFERAGLERPQVFMSNAVRHFKYELRGKRRIHKTPSQLEAAACQHWLEEEIVLVAPRALVALGATAARSLLGRPVAVTLERGQWLRRMDGRWVLTTLHPSALLRMTPEAQGAAFAAFVQDLTFAAGGPPTD